MNTPPCLIWLPADHRLLGEEGSEMPFLVLGDKYAQAIKGGAKAQAVLFPLADSRDIPDLLDLVDGVMLTGSPSNVHPAHFDEPIENPALPLDTQRDALTLALVKQCVEKAIPLLGICRGFQEINIAFGGSLHQQVHHQPQYLDHRGPEDAKTIEEEYGLYHSIRLAPGSVFEQWAGCTEIRVNSLHGQGINRLAANLTPMAHASDGLVEAFAVNGAQTFAYAVQWHPEWHYWEQPFYSAILNAFGQACRLRQAKRTGLV